MRTRSSWGVGQTVITLVALAWSFNVSGDPGGPVPAAKLEHSTKVRVVDGQGQPVADALITSTDFSAVGARPVRTDQTGTAPLEWPQYSPGAGANVLVDHPDFILYSGQVPIGNGDPHVVKLRRGSVAQFMARLPDEQGPAHELRLDVGATRGFRWTEEDGLVTVSRLDLEPKGPKYYARLVQVADHGSSYFSDILDLRQIAAQSPPPTVQMRRGVELRGRLSEVPRPVRAGRIFVAARKLTGDPTMPVWMRAAPVNYEGEFVVHSIPPGTSIDLLALCDGWSSVCPSQDEVMKVIKAAGMERDQTGFRLAGATFRRCELPADPAEAIVVPMERAVDAQVRVLDAAGKPIPDARVEVKWFQFLPGGEYVVLGATTDSIERALKRPSAGSTEPRGVWNFEPTVERSFDGQTDESGLVHLKSVPLGRSNFDRDEAKGQPAIGVRIRVSHPDWKPVEQTAQQSQLPFQFTVRMKEKAPEVAR